MKRPSLDLLTAGPPAVAGLDLDEATPAGQGGYFDWHALVPGCPMCEETGTVFAAIDIVIDGDQIAPTCYQCGRLVRPFSWHDGDGLPTFYLGRFNHHGAAVEVAAWYCDTGAVRLVPAVDPDRPYLYLWPHALDTLSLARAVFAHLVGLDLPPVVWEAAEADLFTPLADTAGRAGGGEWRLAVEDLIEWLAANR